MSKRRQLTRRLNVETRAGRHARLNIDKWLLRPEQKVTRGEAYTLLRQWHYEVLRDVQMRRSYVERVFHAFWLVLTWPVRASLKSVLKRQAKARQSNPPDGEAQ